MWITCQNDQHPKQTTALQNPENRCLSGYEDGNFRKLQDLKSKLSLCDSGHIKLTVGLTVKITIELTVEHTANI